MTPEQEAEYTAIHDLLGSAGWKIFRDSVLAEIAGDFEEHITRALDTNDSSMALDRMRQVASVRKAGLRWLKLPQERMAILESMAEQPLQGWERQTRRPVGV